MAPDGKNIFLLAWFVAFHLPQNMKLAQQLSKPLYTPPQKPGDGEHDTNISFKETEAIVGSELATQIKEVSLKIYQFAAEHALSCGIIIADTKFEFGLDEDNQLTLMDEVLTPDSSRFWSAADYQPGSSPKSYDKQIIRDYLETLDWDKTPPAPKTAGQHYGKSFRKISPSSFNIMQLSGHIDKMHTSLEEGMAHYKLSFDDQQVDMGSLVGQHIEFTFNKTIQCANPECKRALLLKAIHRATVSLVRALWPGVTYVL